MRPINLPLFRSALLVLSAVATLAFLGLASRPLEAGAAACGHGRHHTAHGCSHGRARACHKHKRRCSGRRAHVRRKLTVVVHGKGSVRGPGISCPGDCSNTYAKGKKVSLRVRTDAHSKLAGWRGACARAGSVCRIPMRANRRTRVKFLAAQTPPTDPGSGDPGPGSGDGTCAVDPETMTSPDCKTVQEDTASNPDAQDVWGSVDCAARSRYQYDTTGGDTHPTASGEAQGNSAFRSLRVLDGDDFWGERCELGHNERRYGETGRGSTGGTPTFALYRGGEHAITFFSERYSKGFLEGVNAWQSVMQMKQAQPYTDDGNQGVALELQIYGGRLHLMHNWSEAWSAPAPAHDTWIRYALDVVYSKDPAVGSVQVFADLNGDGDATDPDEQSPVIHMATLDPATSPGDGLSAGDAIPDHLRLGIYHNPSIDCLPPTGCSVDVDNVEVMDA